MSQQHAHFEEESGGEPSDQISSAPRYEVPPWYSRPEALTELNPPPLICVSAHALSWP
jgi:hypothetical protein